MTYRMTEDEIYEQAKNRVKQKREFFKNLGSWASVNLVLVVIWALTGAGYPWFLWPLGIWGVILVTHYVRIYLIDRGSDRVAIEKEVERIRRDQA